jgi:outer membrane protein, heavy metal efflux system
VALHTCSIARRVAAAGGALVLLLCAGLAAAADDPRRNPGGAGADVAPPVGDLVARALANAPSLGARRARLAAAEAASKAADVLPDPMLEFEWKDGGFPAWTLGTDPMSMIGGTIRQPLVSKGRKTARRAEAAAEVGVRHAETDAAACDITMAVRTEYARLYAIDRERAILRDSGEMARLLAETAAARYASGSTDQATVLRAQVELTRFSERAVDLEAERATVVVAMNRLLNQPPDTPLGEVRDLPETVGQAGPIEGQADLAASVAPEVSVRKAEVTAATERVAVMKADLRPNWTVGGSFFWQGGTNRVASVIVGVDWPWHKDRKQLPLIASSERELEAARLDLEDTAAGMRAEAARLGVEIKRSEDQIVRYRSGLLPQSSAALDAARASYLAGRGDFASVLDEFRRWTEIRIEIVRREASRFAARAQLDVLVNPVQHGDWAPAIVKPPTPSKEPRS